MVQEVHGGREELMSRYGCRERLAVRIGALRRKGLGITGVLLEEAARDPELEALLLSAPLLEQAGSLDSGTLSNLGPAAGRLALVGRTLALDEELQAEEGFSPDASAGSALAPHAPSRPPGARLDPAEVRLVLPPDEIARTKLTLLTGTDPGARIESLRKLSLASIPTEEKGFLALRALLDPSAEVRSEAAAALEAVGLDRDLAETLRTAATGTPRQRELAFQRAAALGRKAPTTERSVAAAFLAGALEFEREPSVLAAILEAIPSFAELLVANREVLSLGSRNLMKALADRLDVLARPARAALEALAAVPGFPARAFWDPLEGVSDRKLKVFFLETLLGIPLDPDFEKDLCRLAAQDLLQRPLEDLESRRLADALRLRSDTALEALLEAARDLTETAQSQLIPVLDAIASSEATSDPLRQRTAQFFLDLIRTGSRTVRTAILEARLVWHPLLAARLKRDFAADFLQNLHAYRAARIHELTLAAVRRIGWEAGETLRSCIRKSPYPVERDAAARLLAEIAREAAPSAADAADAMEFLLAQRKRDRLSEGLILRAAGEAAQAVKDRPALARLAERLDDRWKKGGRDPDLIAAMGWFGSAAAVSGGTSADFFLRMASLLHDPLPDISMGEAPSPEGPRLVVGTETDVYTELMPEILAALRRILLAGRLPEKVRSRELERMAVRYEALVEYREVWAPGNVMDLGEVLGAAASAPFLTDSERTRILGALLGNLRNTATVRIVSAVLEDPARAPAPILHEFVERVLDLRQRPEYQERDDQKVLIEALARVATHRRLAADRKEGERRREQIVELLLENKDWLRSALPFLERIAAAPGLPRDLRTRLKGVRR